MNWGSQATNSFERPTSGTTVPSSGCSSGAAPMAISKRDTTPANTACTTMPTWWTQASATLARIAAAPPRPSPKTITFLSFRSFQQKLLDFYEANPDFIRPEAGATKSSASCREGS